MCTDITLFYGSRKIFSLPEFHVDAHKKILLQRRETHPAGQGTEIDIQYHSVVLSRCDLYSGTIKPPSPPHKFES